MALHYVPAPLRTPELCLEAVQRSSLALYLVPPALKESVEALYRENLTHRINALVSEYARISGHDILNLRLGQDDPLDIELHLSASGERIEKVLVGRQEMGWTDVSYSDNGLGLRVHDASANGYVVMDAWLEPGDLAGESPEDEDEHESPAG